MLAPLLLCPLPGVCPSPLVWFGGSCSFHVCCAYNHNRLLHSATISAMDHSATCLMAGSCKPSTKTAHGRYAGAGVCKCVQVCVCACYTHRGLYFASIASMRKLLWRCSNTLSRTNGGGGECDEKRTAKMSDKRSCSTTTTTLSSACCVQIKQPWASFCRTRVERHRRALHSGADLRKASF